MTHSGLGRFLGRTIIVTGAGSGVGRATVIRLAGAGARVIATDPQQELLDQLVTDLNLSNVVTVAGVAGDKSTIIAVLAAAGPSVAALVNVAGITDALRANVADDAIDWYGLMAGHFAATLQLTRAVSPLMAHANRGSIVTVSPDLGAAGSVARSASTTAKHVALGFITSIAFDLAGSGVRSNGIAPSGVATAITAPLDLTGVGQQSPYLGEFPPLLDTNEDIADAIAWLVCDDSMGVSSRVLATRMEQAAVVAVPQLNPAAAQNGAARRRFVGHPESLLHRSPAPRTAGWVRRTVPRLLKRVDI